MKTIEEKLLDKWNPTGLLEQLNIQDKIVFVGLLQKVSSILIDDVEKLTSNLEKNTIIRSLLFLCLRRIYDLKLSKPIDCNEYFLLLSNYIYTNYDDKNKSVNCIDYETELCVSFANFYKKYIEGTL